MEYVIGIVLALAVAGFAVAVGFDRERAFYPTVLIIVATYYILFAAMGGMRNTLIIESLVAAGFAIVAVLGYRKSAWLLAAGLIGHGLFDFIHHLFIDNPGMPLWWPGFCGAFDVVIGVFLAVRLTRRVGATAR
jgi:hypothetical protein